MPVNNVKIDSKRLLSKLDQLGEIGRTSSGGISRLALSDEDKAGRDLVVSWMKSAGLIVKIDKIGNIFGVRSGEQAAPAVMSGSHLDTVINGGKLDGAYGVLAALEIVETLNNEDIETPKPIVVAVFTNEEGVRFQPDMMGSLAHAGGLSVDSVLDRRDRNGVSIRAELNRIGYLGNLPCGEFTPSAFVELHIEQGPVLERSGRIIGIVDRLQGISWTEIEIHGVANHAGTTPMHLRQDAGYCAAEISTFLHALAGELGHPQVATVGSVELKPNAINVVPGYARITADMRNTDDTVLTLAESRLEAFCDNLVQRQEVKISTRRLARFSPVTFSEDVARVIEGEASRLNLTHQRMTSGAGHDAQMMSRICPTAMIFVPSRNGISHSPNEHTDDEYLIAGANVLLRTILALSGV